MGKPMQHFAFREQYVWAYSRHYMGICLLLYAHVVFAAWAYG